MAEHASILPSPLRPFGRRVYCQVDEDGILECILDRLGLSAGTFVEIGVGPGLGLDPLVHGFECNCRLLEEMGWSGWFFDKQSYPYSLDIIQATVTASNVNEILSDCGIPSHFDVLSLDIDGQDYWVWQALDWCPSVVVIEYNASLPMNRSMTVQRDDAFQWDGTNYFGASLKAMNDLARSRGYSLVDANGVNAFFVRTKLISNVDDFRYDDLFVHAAIHPNDPLDREWVFLGRHDLDVPQAAT